MLKSPVTPHAKVLDTAGLWISAGANDGSEVGEVTLGSPNVEFMSQVAVANKMVTAILYQEYSFVGKAH